MAIYHIDMPHHVPPVDNWLSLSMLRLLVGVSQTGSLSGSAKVAGIAQSNASRSLKTLERRLGYPAGALHAWLNFDAGGQLTVEWAREALDAVDRLALGANVGAHKRTELTIVASMTIAEHLLPGWIGTFRSLYPGLNTKLKVMNSSEVIEAVEHDKGELGFVETPQLPDSLQSTPVRDDQLVAVVGPTHPWAQQPPELTASQLANTALIEREEGSGTRAFSTYLLVGNVRSRLWNQQ